ncbi:PH domain-containing protein [Nocardia sp. 004]|uniref:PH domain-containing protein n=1 Tax=Nocardia sp. 004 TaxID=3385978 RepID=UPI00399F0EB5
MASKGLSRKNAEKPAASGAAPEWEFEVRPRRAVRTSWIVAILIAVVFTVGGVTLRTGSTGVNFRFVDQIAMIVVGILGGAAVLLLTKPRVRAGAHGVTVRNVMGDKDFSWEYVRGVSFPDRKSWARLELVHDEYVPLMAIRSNDKEHAMRAMDQLRELIAKYSESA